MMVVSILVILRLKVTVFSNFATAVGQGNAVLVKKFQGQKLISLNLLEKKIMCMPSHLKWCVLKALNDS